MAKEKEFSEQDIIKMINTQTTVVGTDLNRAIQSYNDLMQFVQLYITKVNADKGKKDDGKKA